jgi:uncharacterized protein YgiM (DUF1202 family)
MKLRLTVLLSVIALLGSACNLPLAAPVVALPATAPAAATAAPVTDTPAVPPTETLTPVPSDTPTVTPSPTPETPMVASNDQDVNCRFGPNTTYITTGALKVGESAPILGKSSDGGWFQIQDLRSTNKCWVGSSVTTVTGDLSMVPFATPPQTFVNGVSADTPEKISVPGCLGSIPPLSVSGSIEVNGPIKVSYHFESQQGNTFGAATVFFPAFGTHTVSSSFTPALTAGTYWLKLVVTSPNNMVGQSSYKIVCP